MRRGEEVDSPQCVGRPGEHFDVRVVNELDEELPPGGKGEIIFRPRHPFTTMQSYYEDPANTLKACRNLWFHTGDLGSTDEKGNVYFYERMGDTIRRRGVNIPSFHIEEVALAYPGVAEAVAVGVPAEVGEFEVKLCILEAEPNAVSPEGLVRWLGKQLPREMVPRYLEVKESFSRTITQKVIKRELKEEGITPRTITTDQWLGA
jgi:carnitine-CoA ligase